MNSIFVIAPYWQHGTWVFDDKTVGVIGEPFVAGTDDIITAMVKKAGIPNAKEGFQLVFSAHEFPGAYRVKWVREEMAGDVYDGDVYEWNGIEGRLCPVLLEYFKEAPHAIYVQLRAAEEVPVE